MVSCDNFSTSVVRIGTHERIAVSFLKGYV